jgi:predicted RND superfamily exporter protein
MPISRIAHHLGLFIRNRPLPVLFLLGLVTFVCGYSALQSKVDNSLAVWQSSNDPHWNRYQQFVREHHLTDPLLIYLPGATPESTELLVEQLEEIQGVYHLSSTGMQPKTGGQAELISLFPEENATPHSLSILLAQAEQILKQKNAGPYHLGGVWLLTDRLDKLSARSTQTMFPLVIGLLAAVLLLLRFPIRDVILIMVCGLLPAFQLAGLMALFGIKMNMILLALPPLTMILGISHAIHLISKKQGEHEEPMDIFARIASPCLLSGLTTSLGFLSLLLSSYQPVRQLGLWGAVGTLLSLLCSLLLLPLFFQPVNKKLPFNFLERLPGVIIRWKTIILAGLVAAILLGLAGAQQLQRGSFILDFFTPGSSVQRDYHEIESGGTGLTPLELDLGKTILSNKDIEKNMHLLAASQPEITHILYGFASGLIVPQATENGAVFNTMADLNFMLEKINRITLLTKTLASEKTLELVNQIETFCQLRFGIRRLAYVTGSVPLYTRGQKKLFSSLVISFSAAFISISLIMGIVLRSLRLGLLAILPNILPVILVLGVMGVVGIPLSVATVTVASIVFGIVVDDTIHFLHSWQNVQYNNKNCNQQLQQVFTYAGPAMMTTTLVAGIGFLGFAVSPFLPLRNFGLLISLAMWLALFCDLILLPALLITTRPK